MCDPASDVGRVTTCLTLITHDPAGPFDASDVIKSNGRSESLQALLINLQALCRIFVAQQLYLL